MKNPKEKLKTLDESSSQATADEAASLTALIRVPGDNKIFYVELHRLFRYYALS